MRLWFENKCSRCTKEFNDQEEIIVGGVGVVTLKPSHILVDQDRGLNIPGPVQFEGDVQLICRPCYGTENWEDI